MQYKLIHRFYFTPSKCLRMGLLADNLLEISNKRELSYMQFVNVYLRVHFGKRLYNTLGSGWV